jgi:hypothetical protein
LDGWHDREHTNYGYHLGRIPERMARFREATQIMVHLLRSAQRLMLGWTEFDNLKGLTDLGRALC